jgi:hypothetical protein
VAKVGTSNQDRTISLKDAVRSCIKRTVQKSAVTKQGAFSCVFGIVKKAVIRAVQPTCWAQQRILTIRYGEPGLHW